MVAPRVSLSPLATIIRRRGLTTGNGFTFARSASEGDQIWRIPAEGGPAKQITTHGGWSPAKSADQKYLFYSKSKHNGIWRISLSGGDEQQVVSNVAAFGSAYALGKQGIYFISLQGGVGQHLAFLNFATGQVTSLADIPRPLFLGLTVSPDERILLYSQMDHVNSDLMLVEHFHWRESSVLDLTSNAITVFR